MNQYVVTVDGQEYDVDAPDEGTAWRWAKQFHAERMAKRQKAIQDEEAATREQFRRQEAERPWLEKAVTNIGAGMDTLWQGAKQLVGAGPSEEELRDKRERDAMLSEVTPGGGALQVAGQILPTLAVPAGAYARGAQLLTGGRVLKNATTLKKAIADSAIAGGTFGALMPTAENESRALNILGGAVGGAAVPAAFGGAKKLYRTMTHRGAAARAGDVMLETLGGEQGAKNAVAAIDTYYPKGAEDIPLSTAAILENPKLGMAERASRARDPAKWLPLDEATNKAAFENIERATANADKLDELRALRQENWLSRQAKASSSVKQGKFLKELDKLYQNIEQALKSPPGQNQMRPVLLEIKRQFDELGPEITPEHLMTLRANMQGAIRGQPGNVFESAPRTDPYYISLKQEFDRILNNVTGGKWQKVIEGYAKESAPVQAAKSSQAIRDFFETPQGVSRTSDLGGHPTVSNARLRRALAKFGENKYGDALEKETRQRLEATVEALRKAELPQRLKAAGTAGGGSNTAMDIAAIAAHRGIPGGGILQQLWSSAAHRGDRLLQEEIDNLLLNPEAFKASVLDALRRGEPLSPAKAQILAVLHRAPTATGPLLLSE